MSFPAMSGAEPPDGSNKPFLFAPNAAEPSMAIERKSLPLRRKGRRRYVADDDHVERRRRPHELRCRIVDVEVRQLDIGIFGATRFIVSRQSCDVSSTLARRLDRMARQIERLERQVRISNEAVALFVRFWLMSRPPRASCGPSQGPRTLRGLRRGAEQVAGLGHMLGDDGVTAEMTRVEG